MVKKKIAKWVDGDSGIFSDGKKFRLSEVRAPEKHQFGGSKATRIAAGMTGISITAVILTQVDKLVLSKILTLEKFGYYTLASIVAGALYSFILPVIFALFPRFVQLISANDQYGLRGLYHKSCQFLF